MGRQGVVLLGRTGAKTDKRAVIAVLFMVMPLAAGGAVFLVHHHPGARRGRGAGRSVPKGLANLPFGAQGPVSAGLGADDPAYLVHGRGRLHALNPSQRSRVSFARSGVLVNTGGSRLSLALAAIGYGPRLRGVAGALPQATTNRVRYERGPVSEWYANGPLGLEQGFTIEHRLDWEVRGPLTLSLTLAGDLRPVLSRGGRELAFRAADGRTVLRYGGLSATDAQGRELQAYLSLRGPSLMIRVNVHGARYPVRIDPFIQSAELIASDGAAGDELGDSVAVSGSTIVAGAPQHTVAGHSDQGAVYVFSVPAGGGWKNATQTAELTASDGAAGDQLGYSVAFSGSTIVAGAPGARAVTGLGGEGAVYVFSAPTSGVWKNTTQTAELTASDGAAADELGSSVAISDSTIAASAPEHTVAGNGGQGAVYVFSASVSGRWQNSTQRAELTASDGAASDELGGSVAISGSTIAAAAGGHTVAGHDGQGAVYAYSQPASGWKSAAQTAELTASDGAPGDGLGDSVAISGSTIAAGSMLHAVRTSSQQGAVYVFSAPAAGWSNATQTAELTASNGAPGDGLGYSTAFSGSTIVAGAYGAAGEAGDQQGALYLFSQPASGWKSSTQTGELSASDAASGDELGYSVAIFDTLVAAGAPERVTGTGKQQGSVYVFSGLQPPPAVSSVNQSHKRWREGNRLASFARAVLKPPVGTTFRFTLNQSARVSFDFTRAVTGRMVGRRCVAVNTQNRRGRTCTRVVDAGSLSFTGHAATNKVFFEGLLSRHRRLSAASYTLIIVATNAGLRSRPQRLSFTIVR